MAWNISERFPSWGEAGEFPAAGFFYEGGDQVNEKHMDALWNGINGLEEDVQAALNDIDSNSDGKVDNAEQVDGQSWSDIQDWVNNNADVPNADYADNAGTVGGEAPSAFADTNHGNEEHSTDFTTLTEVNNNADVPNADHADEADFATEAGNGIPSNIISLWSGSISNIPSGWVLCDGNNGTPDLRNRFIVGAGGQYSVDDTGGAEQVQLTEAEMPSHNHTFSGGSPGYGNTNWAGEGATGSSTTTSSAGGDEAHENRPPYYALAYIMKV